MTRTVEVGRAVLASSKENFELWLTTLIDISPSQQATNIERFSSPCLLQYLSSGNAWVGRANGMRIELVLSVRGMPFPKRELQELRDKITRAPIWAQLNLKPSICPDNVLRAGMAHIAISHSEHEDATEEKKHHRIFDKVPAADMKPPESMFNIQLQVVRFNVDILEPRVRLQVKRSNTLPDGIQVESDNAGGKGEQTEDVGAQLHETFVDPENEQLSASLTTPPISRKRKRPGKRIPSRAISSPVLPLARDARSRRHQEMPKDLPVSDQDILTEVQLDEITLMIDGAMRHSILGAHKSPTGIKVKANTFVVGLADVAPVLWRPGYLFALSQRAHLIPTITRSFGHLVGTKATTISLGDKVKKLTSPAPGAGGGSEPSQNTAVVTQFDRLSSSFADHIWSHLQRSLLTRPAPSPQAFVSSKHVDHPDSDMILDDADQQREPSDRCPHTMQEGPTINIADSKLLTFPTSHNMIEQDDVGHLVADITVDHHDAGLDSLYVDTGAHTPLQGDDMPSEGLITSGSMSSLGTSEDKAALVFAYGEESLTTPTEGHQWVEEDLLFEDHTETMAAAEEYTMLPSS